MYNLWHLLVNIVCTAMWSSTTEIQNRREGGSNLFSKSDVMMAVKKCVNLYKFLFFLFQSILGIVVFISSAKLVAVIWRIKERWESMSRLSEETYQRISLNLKRWDKPEFGTFTDREKCWLESQSISVGVVVETNWVINILWSCIKITSDLCTAGDVGEGSWDHISRKPSAGLWPAYRTAGVSSWVSKS